MNFVHLRSVDVTRNDLGSSGRGRVHLALATESSSNVDEATAVKRRKKRKTKIKRNVSASFNSHIFSEFQLCLIFL